MRKTALTFTVTTLVLGVFGAFFRWLQLMNAFDKETGFPVPGAGITPVLIVYCVLALAAFCVLTLVWLGRYDRAQTAETALKCGTVAPLIISWALCAAFAFLFLLRLREKRLPAFLSAGFLTGCAGFLFLMSSPSEWSGRRGEVSESTLTKAQARLPGLRCPAAARLFRIACPVPA